MRHLLASIALLGLTASSAAAKVDLQLQIADEPVVAGATTRITAIAQVDSGWHVNAHRPNEPFLIPTAIRLELPPGVTAGEMTYPAPEAKTFAFAEGKELLVYEGEIVMSAALAVAASAAPGTIDVTATLRYQACNDTTCLPPRDVTTTAAATVVAPGAAAPAPGGGAGEDALAAGGIDFAHWLEERGLLLTLPLVLLLGVGLNLTPCVYPLI